jgi:hypothetical protein
MKGFTLKIKEDAANKRFEVRVDESGGLYKSMRAIALKKATSSPPRAAS